MARRSSVRFLPVRALTGTAASKLLVFDRRSRNGISWLSRLSRSILFTTAMTFCEAGMRARTAWSSSLKRPASTTKSATSASRAASVARRLSARANTVRERNCCPGASMNTYWQSSRVSTPVTRWRVVCGFAETMDSFWPTRRLSRLDFPVFGRPAMPTVPHRCTVIAQASSGELFEHRFGGLLLRALARAAAADGRELQGRHCAFHVEAAVVRLSMGGDHAVFGEAVVARLE